MHTNVRRMQAVLDQPEPDLAEVARLTGLGVDEVIAAHTETPWRAAFGGFAPGFVYLVGGDPRLRVPRLASPRTRVPAGSVALADEFGPMPAMQVRSVGYGAGTRDVPGRPNVVQVVASLRQTAATVLASTAVKVRVTAAALVTAAPSLIETAPVGASHSGRGAPVAVAPALTLPATSTAHTR